MIKEWLFRRIFDQKTCAIIAKNMIPYIKETAAESIHEILDDEEVLEHVKFRGDEIFNYYKAKVMGTIGGMQKGINAATGRANPLKGIITSKGIDLSGLLGMAAQHFLFSGGNNGSSQQNPSRPMLPGSTPQQRNVVAKWPQ